MKKALLVLGLFAAPSWATYIPVNGSTVNLQNVINPVQITLTTVTFNGTSQPVNVLSSTVGVVNGGSTLSVYATNNTTTTVNQSTVGVVNGGSTFQTYQTNPSTVTVQNSTMGVVSASNLNVYQVNPTTVTLQNVVYADSSAYTLNTSSFMTIGGVYIPTGQQIPTGSTVTAGVRISPYRSEYMTLMDNSGVILGTATTNALQVAIVASTFGAVNGGSTFQTYQTNNSTATVIQSTVGVVNGGSTFQTYQTNPSTTTIQNSTMGVTNASMQLSVQSTYTVVTDTWSVPINVLASTIGVVNGGSTLSVYATNNTTTTVTQSTVGVTNTSMQLSVQSTYTVVTATQGSNGNSATTNRLNVNPGIAQNLYGNNGNAFTQGKDASQMILSSSGLLGTWSGPDNTIRSYHGSTTTFAVAITSGDITGLCGNSFSTTTVVGLRISCTQTTAGNFDLAIVRRSSAYSCSSGGGCWSTMTVVGDDTNYSVTNSTAIFFTGNNMANGTLVSYLDNYILDCNTATAAVPSDIYISPAWWRQKSIVLRGPSQCIGANAQGTALSGNKFTATWEWMETSTP